MTGSGLLDFVDNALFKNAKTSPRQDRRLTRVAGSVRGCLLYAAQFIVDMVDPKLGEKSPHSILPAVSGFNLHSQAPIRQK